MLKRNKRTNFPFPVICCISFFVFRIVFKTTNTLLAKESTMNRLFPALQLLVLILCPVLLNAQEAQKADTSGNAPISAEYVSFDELMKMGLISSSKFEQKANETPNVISLITNKQIEQNGWNSLNDILYKLPGFGPSQDYDRNTVSSRGLFEGWNNNHLLLLIDGMPFNDNLYGTAYTWEISPLIFAKNVEIIRGPGAALYGSNATNGVIQINTFTPEDLEKQSKAGFRIGNYGERIITFLTGNTFENFSYVVAFNHSETAGNEYDSYDGSGVLDANNNPVKFRTNDNRQNNYVWVKLKGINEYSDLSLQYHYQQWQYQTGHGWLWFTPDFSEAMNENRHLVTLKYTPKIGSVATEFSARYQRHELDWNTRLYRNGALSGFYPAGMWEYLNTAAQDVFLRAQGTYELPEKASFLLGVETDIFFYNGDNSHYSNVDVNNTFAPFYVDNRPADLGPFLDYIKGHSDNNIGIYAQFVSGKFIGDKLTATLGIRYDTKFFTYTDLAQASRPESSKSYSQVSPRGALVYKVNDDLSLKLMSGRAFRAPAPTELFGAHTYLLASNISKLKPEVITTSEIAFDWTLNKYMNWRTNYYYTKSENQIAYSAQNNNLSANLYTLTNTGFESELLFGVGNMNGYFNFSYAKRISEQIEDNTIAPSDNLTWEPPVKINFGIAYHFERLLLALNAHYESKVERRATDKGIETLPLGVGVALNMDQFRGSSVNQWFTTDFNSTYTLSENLKAGFAVYNLFDTEYYLVKTLGFPFDYRQQGRRFTVSMEIVL